MLLADERFRDFFKCPHNKRSHGVATGMATVADKFVLSFLSEDSEFTADQ